MQKTAIGKSLIIATVIAAAMGAASAQDKSGYALDSSGAVVKSGFGLCWRTGSWTPSMAIAECDPDLARGKPMAAAPAAAGPAAAASASMALSADGLFAFGKSTLKADGKKQLDAFVAKLGGRKLDKVVVTGHTDRFGSAKFNQKLSQKRADAVKAYLAGKGVDAAKIMTEGKGSSMPKTSAKQCDGKKSAKVIACLAADRRVEIEATFAK